MTKIFNSIDYNIRTGAIQYDIKEVRKHTILKMKEGCKNDETAIRVSVNRNCRQVTTLLWLLNTTATKLTKRQLLILVSILKLNCSIQRKIEVGLDGLDLDKVVPPEFIELNYKKFLISQPGQENKLRKYLATLNNSAFQWSEFKPYDSRPEQSQLKLKGKF